MSCRTPIIGYSRLLSILLLAGVFSWSGLTKLLDPEGFSLAVYRYHLVPAMTVNMLSLWLTALELMCAAILLLLPRLRPASLKIILCLLIIFTIGIGLNLMRGNQMACGCFSTSPLAHPTGWVGLLKNLGLMLLAAYALAGPRPGNREA